MSEFKMNKSSVIIYEFNQLAEGLVGTEFISINPRGLSWNVRGNKIVKLLDNLFNQGADIVVTVENDHPIEIAEKLQKTDRRIDCCFQRIRSKDNKNSGFTQLLKRSKIDRSFSFRNSIRNESDLLAFLDLINLDKPADCQTEFSIIDPYVADYTTCIYWNTSKVESIPPFSEFNPFNFVTTRGYKIYDDRGDGGFVQTFMKDGIEFNVLAAHLKSGESEKDESSRVSQLTQLLTTFANKKNPIIAMDSNSSMHYVQGIPENIYTVLSRNDFYNVINELLKVCFKVRGADGDQPPKFAEMVYDGIDKICVKNGVVATPCNLPGEPILRCLEYSDLLYRLRTVSLLRDRIGNWILNAHNTFDDNGKLVVVEHTSELRYSSGECVPIIDNKTKEVLKFMSSDKLSRWGQDMRLNSCVGMAEYLRNGREGETVFNDLVVTDEQLMYVFGYLCPNDELCSDHPPVGAVVEIYA
jgi:hypothetical protein